MNYAQIGPAVVTICESTAHCTVNEPYGSFVEEIVKFVEKHNYVVDAIYGRQSSDCIKLASQTGGVITRSVEELKSYQKNYS